MKEFKAYPKWINVPGMENGGLVVFSEEEGAKYVVQKEAAKEVEKKPEEAKRRGRPRKEQ